MIQVLLILAASLCAPPASREAAVKKEMEKLQGIWAPVSSRTEGEEAQKIELDIFRLTVKGDRWSYAIKGGAPIFDLKFVLDPAATPKTLDVLSEKNPGKFALTAIYELDGDNLRICFGVGENAVRPKKFTSAAGSKCGITLYKRSKQ